jgi:hypothetical protein
MLRKMTLAEHTKYLREACHTGMHCQFWATHCCKDLKKIHREIHSLPASAEK